MSLRRPLSLRDIKDDGQPLPVHPGMSEAALGWAADHAAPWTIIEMDVTDGKDDPHRHIDFVYVCRAAGGYLVAQVGEVAGARWVPVADLAGLPTPVELPELVAAAARWAKTQR